MSVIKWIFGGIDIQTRRGFLQVVPNRNQTTLLSEIERRIHPGTEIHSDCWAAYNGISAIPVIPPYIHRTVNHQHNFVNRNDGTTTNHVERMWKEAKQKFKRMNGTRRDMIP